jgi:mRNA interferase HigB
MNVIKKKTLEAFWTKHNQSEAALVYWFKVSRKALCRNFADVKTTLRSADAVKVASGKTATIFNVGGNKIRVIALIDYPRQVMLVTHVLTHKA